MPNPHHQTSKYSHRTLLSTNQSLQAKSSPQTPPSSPPHLLDIINRIPILLPLLNLSPQILIHLLQLLILLPKLLELLFICLQQGFLLLALQSEIAIVFSQFVGTHLAALEWRARRQLRVDGGCDFLAHTRRVLW